MTVKELFFDHAHRVAEVTRWHTLGWISDRERVKYLACEEDITQTLWNQTLPGMNY